MQVLDARSRVCPAMVPRAWAVASATAPQEELRKGHP